MSPSNHAAWLTAAKAYPLEVGEAPYPSPAADEVVVKAHAVAVNPVDWKIQQSGAYVKNYPTIVGTDVAGVVEEVGSGVKQFKKGDRVLAHCNGLGTGNPAHNAFQLYPTVPAITTAKLPDHITFTDATVLPLALSTAAAGLYQPSHLALPYPTDPPTPTDKLIVVWGGASSVGATAIQLAIASGVTVIATASPRNFDFVKSLGAQSVFDYTSASVESDVVRAVQASGRAYAGAYDAISLPASFSLLFAIVAQLQGDKKVATVLPPTDVPEGVEAIGVFAITVGTAHRAVGEAVWGKFVPRALADGSLRCLPEAIVVGKGLNSVQAGLDKQKEGVSAKKVVVELD